MVDEMGTAWKDRLPDVLCDEDILHYYLLAKTQQKKGQVA
jgi:hypothetical protein